MNYNINTDMYNILKHLTNDHIESLYERFNDLLTFFEQDLLDQIDKNDENAIIAVHDYIAQNLHTMINESHNHMNKALDDMFNLDTYKKEELKE